ncbi:MAG: B12-binding domain-containing radical SAM protein [Methermicoccaceae archaeon]
MKVIFVNPPRFNGIPVIREDRCEITERSSLVPPYSLLQGASALREEGHMVKVLDANGFGWNLNQIKSEFERLRPELVVMRFTPTTFDLDMEVSRLASDMGAKVAGMCWTLKPFAEQVLTNSPLDYYVIGDYESVIPSLVSSIEEGKSPVGVAYKNEGEFVMNTHSPPFDYDNLPLPAYDEVAPLSRYYINTPHGSPFTIMYTSKGCPYSCIYCTVRKTKWRGRSAESILTELRELKDRYNIRTVSFFDEIFTFDKDRVVELCDGMISEGMHIRWYCNTRVDHVEEDLLRLMREAGCRGISFGVESGSDKILKMAKKGATVEQAEDAVQAAKRAGLKTLLSFMFGLPGESPETVDETISFVRRVLPTGAQFNVAVPYPGTELYELCRKEGYINNLDWRDLFQHHAVLRTVDMTAGELERARLKAYRSLYFNPRWVLSNVRFLLREPEELPLAVKYYIKSLKNYLLYGMKHAH